MDSDKTMKALEKLLVVAQTYFGLKRPGNKRIKQLRNYWTQYINDKGSHSVQSSSIY